MPRTPNLRRLAMGCVSLIGLLALAPGLAHAQVSDLDQLRAQIDAQQAQLERQAKDLADMRATLGRMLSDQLDEQRARGADPEAAPAPVPQRVEPLTVGEKPASEPQTPAPELAALPDGVGVLTPKGRVLIDPSLDVTLSSSNRLVFRGVEVVTGVQIGAIEASDVDRQTFGGSLTARYGVTDRFEVEARIPYVMRKDRITTLAQQQSQITQTSELEGSNIGDIELAARYQLNSGAGGGPVYVGNIRYKSDTGKSPFEVNRDPAGVASELPTGSGFWGVEPSLTVLIPSDPTVIFANLGYLYHAPKDIDRTINGAMIGKVDPGDSINLGLGFGFSVNPRFSFSLGYRHSYIFPTKTEFDGVQQTSEELNSGALQFGWSYRMTEKFTINNNFEFGVTEDAPDMRVVLRVPFLM